MKFQIDYFASYVYEEPVSLSPHSIRIFPRQDLLLRVASMRFEAPPTADCQFRRDLFDNDVAVLFFPEVVREFSLEFHAVVETPERNPFHFLLDSRALELPVKYTAEEERMLAGYLSPNAELKLPDELRLRSGTPTIETLVSWNQWCHEKIRYERRDEGDAKNAVQTLGDRSGACRDTAVLFAAILRANGLPARMVSGFLAEGEAEEGATVAENAMHAWVEVWLPGAGWIGLDPTNGVLCDHHSIVTAVGIHHRQISPVAGTYFADHAVGSQLSSKVSVKLLEEAA